MIDYSDNRKVLDHIAQAIYDKKGRNILALDVRGISTMTEYFLIAEGTVDRHVKALCQEIVNQLLPHCGRPLHCEGENVGDWIVLDYGAIVIHLFTPEMRERYQLEQLWREGEIVDLDFNIVAEGQ